MTMRFRIADYNYLFQRNITVTAANEDPDFPVSNLGYYSRSRVYRTTVGTKTAVLTIDLGSPEPIDTFAVLFDPLRPVPISTAATIKIEGNASNVWTAPDYTAFAPFNWDSLIAFHNLASIQELRYWRITVTEPSIARDRVEIGKIILAGSSELGRLPKEGFTYALEDQSNVQTNAYGHRYVDVYPLRKNLSFSIEYMGDSDLTLLEGIYRRNGLAVPMLITLDPEGDVFNPSRFSLYGAFAQALSFQQMRQATYSSNIAFTEVF